MAAKRTKKKGEVVDYRHKTSSRLNIPPAGIAARGKIVKEKKIEYAYNPHLSPALRFDGTGGSDRILELVDAAPRRVLTADEAKLLREAFRNHEPWLEWAGKREELACVADPVALHMHERVSTQAILRVAKREDVQRDLFADPEHDYKEAVQFYRHSVDWTNRMILGDSLAVMASLARREALAGKVQMIYMDPPYGIKYASNFQPEVSRRDVKDKDEDLTREPEMVKAYRDTWTLGVHSYLSYLRDRLLLCKELLADTGSVFVQINDVNLHKIRCLMDEVFGASNQCALIAYRTTGGQETRLLGSVCDYLLWYAKDIDRVKYRQVFFEKVGDGDVGRYRWIQSVETGAIRESTQDDAGNLDKILQSSALLVHDNITSQGTTKDSSGGLEWAGRTFAPPKNSHWKTTPDGMRRLANADRLMAIGDTLRFKRLLRDFSVSPTDAVWEDTAISGFGRKKQYVVETNTKVIERCMHMTTDPGDLVVDPTCGSGTTAFVAENWGRRWITIDVSRVALAIARQRLLTAKFDYFKLCPTSAQDVQRNPNGPWLTDPSGEIQGACTFDCKTVPHITLKSIAQNPALDPIFAKWEPVLDERLAALNAALAKVTKDTRQKLALKLMQKEKSEGKRAVTDADQRRWILPNVDATPSSRISAKRGEGAAFTELRTYFDPSEPIGRLSGGNLPHWRQDGVTYFVTFRTADSMPKARVEQWTREREEWLAAHPEPHDEDTRREYYHLFPERWQNWLDECHGACELVHEGVAAEVERCIRHDDGKQYRLDEFVVMPNHVHALVTPLGEHRLSDILQAWKSVSSHAINKLLDRKGTFWQKESFDHIVRSPEQIERIRAYIRDNPVDATPSSRQSQERGEGAASTSGGWQHWEVPFDTDPDWPKALRDALEDYRRAWREKMDEVNACIAARADQEELVDQPEVDRGKVRVSGPFTMEGIIPAEDSVGEEGEEISRRDAVAQSPIGGTPESLETFGEEDEPIETDSQNAEAYLDRMIRLLREDGVRFPNNKTVQFKTLEPLTDGSILHADGTWATNGSERQVAIMIGPQYGALNALMVEAAIGRARRGGYDDLVFAAFSFEGAAQALIQEDPDPKLRIHMAQIRPDVNMGDLLKTTTSSQLFTVSGMPRTRVDATPSLRQSRKQDRGGGAASTTTEYVVHMEGVDIYDPVTNSVRSAGAQKVAAWFLDSDYDGRCFCIAQAFFPDKTAWAKLGKALSGTLDEAAFEKLSGTVSLPFPAGPHKRVAVKVIDPRGNEVMRVHRLGETTYDE
jgi:DNA modification methylase/REP element-mobilizing transposase RayT